MREVPLGDTGLTSSVLGFGCGSVGGRVGARQATRAMELAFERGVTYFDTARSYGYGESERILGAFLRGKRDRVVLATKAGIDAGRAGALRRALKAAARGVFSAIPAARTMARGALGARHVANQFDPARIERSVETSLRELGTDRLDLLFLHACPHAALEDGSLFETLERLRERGRIRAYGVSSSPEVVSSYLERPSAAAVQYEHHLLAPDPVPSLAARRGVAAIGNQPLAGGRILSSLGDRLEDFRSRLGTGDPLREKLEDLSRTVFLDVAVNTILRTTYTQVAVCSMLSESHVESDVAAAESSRFDDRELEAIRRGLERGAPERT